MAYLEGRVADSGVVEITRGHRQSGGHRSLEDVAVLRHLEVSGIRGNNERPARGIVLVDVDEAIRLGERLLAEQDRVHDAEDGGICADGEPQDQHRCGGEPPVAQHAAEAVAQVTRQRVESRRPLTLPFS